MQPESPKIVTDQELEIKQDVLIVLSLSLILNVLYLMTIWFRCSSTRRFSKWQYIT